MAVIFSLISLIKWRVIRSRKAHLLIVAAMGRQLMSWPSTDDWPLSTHLIRKKIWRHNVGTLWRHMYLFRLFSGHVERYLWSDCLETWDLYRYSIVSVAKIPSVCYTDLELTKTGKMDVITSTRQDFVTSYQFCSHLTIRRLLCPCLHQIWSISAKKHGHNGQKTPQIDVFTS